MDRKSLCWALLVVVASSSLIPLTNAAASEPSYCDSDASYPVKVESVDIDPSPVVSGAPATFKISAISDEALSGGKLSIDVFFYGVRVHTENHDLCTKTTCPIEKGSFVLTHSQSLPGFTPSGSYKLKMKLIDVDDKQLTCVNINFKIVRGSLVAQI
uniref:MD-2-related lipid-recognition domain-containing protein n=1 Tax=Picea sitchensis TaxID=3332 RepID=A9NRH8_PICSI|nr:unknown [Picea sitchensis]ABR17915.1 unknown [Picea sitchensis]